MIRRGSRPIEAAVAALEKARIPVRRDEPLARHTSLGIGGPTPLLALPRSTDELTQTVQVFGDNSVPFRVLGAGSNLLVADQPLPFAVIATAALTRPPVIDGTRVVAAAGVFLPTLVRDVSKCGLAGLEFGIGVPGSVGGALRMNAGGWGSEMSRVVRAVRAVHLADGIAADVPFTPCFQYRSAGVATDVVVTEVEFVLQTADSNAVLRTIDGYTSERRRTQPTSARSAGCAFRNPPGDAAGRLIDAAGLKGLSYGGAQVSTLHANFVVNAHKATASEMRTLIAEVKQRVLDTHGVRSEEEIVVWNADLLLPKIVARRDDFGSSRSNAGFAGSARGRT